MTRAATHPIKVASSSTIASDARAQTAGVGVRAGERAVRDQFERLVREHTPSVLALIRRRAGRGVDAEDVAQDAFCKAWAAIQKGDQVRDFRAWILTIAYRAAISASRRAAVRRALLFRANDDCLPPDASAGTPLWELAHRVLTPVQSAALWLTVAEGLTARQCGLVLEKDERAVRMIVSRARKKLAEEARANQLM